MSAADDDAELTVELLADLQAGLLDDDTAARLRNRIRTDPRASSAWQALQRVRGDIGALGWASASEVPPQTVAGVLAALRSAEGRTPHAARSAARPARVVVGVLGGFAAIAAIGIGTAELLDEPTAAQSGSPTAGHITVSAAVPVIPLSRPEILALLHRPPDFGVLGEVSVRASCLNGLGYPASAPVLGAQPVEISAQPGVLLVMPGDTDQAVVAYAVAQNCSAADPGLLASTVVPR
ncbi:hypothetical protein [Mycobacterium sp.]|uniref:hypothetical protein n=1 Tax=Mycobacterium sp. TaxID=1785 RepID=UPI003A88A6A2